MKEVNLIPEFFWEKKSWNQIMETYDWKLFLSVQNSFSRIFYIIIFGFYFKKKKNTFPLYVFHQSLKAGKASHGDIPVFYRLHPHPWRPACAKDQTEGSAAALYNPLPTPCQRRERSRFREAIERSEPNSNILLHHKYSVSVQVLLLFFLWENSRFHQAIRTPFSSRE